MAKLNRSILNSEAWERERGGDCSAKRAAMREEIARLERRAASLQLAIQTARKSRAERRTNEDASHAIAR